MSSGKSYWSGMVVSRRAALRGIAAAGSGLAALSLIGCGGGDGSGASQAGNRPSPVSDMTKGKQGGKLIWQGYGDPGGGLELLKTRNIGVHQLAGLTHDGLLEFRYGTPDHPGISAEARPVLATALPEISGDKLTLTFKIKQGVKFHNGNPLTAEDVKWTYDTGAAAGSPWANDLSFIEKTEAPDASTFVLKTKWPYADVVQSMTQKNFGAILDRRHQESADAERKLVGSGPFLFVSYEPPLITRYKRNPEYHTKPFPYFEEIDRLGTSDQEKKIADFSSKQVHVTYWFPPEERDRIRQARPDAYLFTYPGAGSSSVYFRSDKPPFNDKRVRQALSMAFDRKPLVQAITAGEGEPDQALSWTATNWGFRKPKDLGPYAKYWNLDLTEARRLLSAAGVTLPLRVEIPTWNATVIGQKHVDTITLITSQWRTAGIVDAKLIEETFGQFSPRLTGNYETLMWGPSTQPTNPDIGIQLRNKYYVPPDGIKGPPTLNISYTNNRQLSDLAEKQLGLFDVEARKAVFRQMEDILAEEQYQVPGVSGVLNYFADPSLRNAQMPRDAFNGATPWMKYWWFA